MRHCDRTADAQKRDEVEEIAKCTYLRTVSTSDRQQHHYSTTPLK